MLSTQFIIILLAIVSRHANKALPIKADQPKVEQNVVSGTSAPITGNHKPLKPMPFPMPIGAPAFDSFNKPKEDSTIIQAPASNNSASSNTPSSNPSNPNQFSFDKLFDSKEPANNSTETGKTPNTINNSPAGLNSDVQAALASAAPTTETDTNDSNTTPEASPILQESLPGDAIPNAWQETDRTSPENSSSASNDSSTSALNSDIQATPVNPAPTAEQISSTVPTTVVHSTDSITTLEPSPILQAALPGDNVSNRGQETDSKSQGDVTLEIQTTPVNAAPSTEETSTAVPAATEAVSTESITTPDASPIMQANLPSDSNKDAQPAPASSNVTPFTEETSTAVPAATEASTESNTTPDASPILQAASPSETIQNAQPAPANVAPLTEETSTAIPITTEAASTESVTTPEESPILQAALPVNAAPSTEETSTAVPITTEAASTESITTSDASPILQAASPSETIQNAQPAPANVAPSTEETPTAIPITTEAASTESVTTPEESPILQAALPAGAIPIAGQETVSSESPASSSLASKEPSSTAEVTTVAAAETPVNDVTTKIAVATTEAFLVIPSISDPSSSSLNSSGTGVPVNNQLPVGQNQNQPSAFSFDDAVLMFKNLDEDQF